MVEAQESLFPYELPSPIGKALKKVIAELKTDIEAMDDQAKKKHFEGLQNRYFNETKLFFSEHLYELLYICLLKSLFSPDFIPVSNTLSRQYRESIREEFGVKSGGEFQKQFIEIFKRFIPEPVTVGGSEGFWNKWTRLYFLSSYNRFQIVIKNARKDKAALKKQRVRENEIKKEIMQKYEIPENYINDIFTDDSPATIAFDWAVRFANIKIKENPKKREERAFGYAYLYQEILGKARDDAEEYSRSKDYELVAANVIYDGAIFITKSKPETKQALKFTLPVPSGKNLQRHNYLLFVKKK
jgi:hypothetical protein